MGELAGIAWAVTQSISVQLSAVTVQEIKIKTL